ncbi:MAG: hypothetical protein AB1762_08350, partial [Gemmatimonadota bacterium]
KWLAKVGLCDEDFPCESHKAGARLTMKFWGVVRFELKYQIRRPWPWLMFAFILVVSFFMTRDAAVQDALFDEFFVNAPFQIAVSTVVGVLMWLLVAPVIAGEAAARDVATGVYPLIYTSPLSKAHYLGGRFIAALVINAVLLVALQLGILAAVYSPGVNAELIGPFRLAAYLTAYGYIALPTAFVGTAIQFALALRSGHPMAGYVGSFIMGFMGVFIASLLLFSRGLGMWLDPIGIRYVIEDIAYLWTTAEKNTRLLTFDGIVLRNRLLWLGIALGVMLVTYVRFHFGHRSETSWWVRWRRRRDARAPEPTVIAVPTAPISAPPATQDFGFGFQVRQALAIGWDSFRVLAKSWAGLFMLAVVPLFSVLVVLDQMLASGSALVPTTGQVLKELTGPLTTELSRWVIVPGLTIFFAGEVIWREREANLGEINDTAPVPDWVPFLGKFLGIAFLLTAFMGMLMVAGMVSQLIRGYSHFEIGLYLTILFGMQLPEYLLFALLALVVHILADQKYIGHVAAVMAYVVIVLAPLFGIEHNLLIYGAGPWWTYTDMRGLTPFVWPWLWFKLYWAAWALLLAVVARLLWVRGKESGLAARLRLARQRLTGASVRAAGLAVGLILSLGGFIFYNTNLRGEGYRSAADLAERKAEYERRYGKYGNVPQPNLTHAKLTIEIHPERRAIDIGGTYSLVNRGALPIDSVHLAVVPGVETVGVTFNRTATPVLQDEDLGHRIYALSEPLQPNDSLQLTFTVRIAPRGFRQDGADLTVVQNGTFFTNNRLPAIGYQRSRELLTPSERREHGLTQRPVIPSLYDAEARKYREPGGIVLEALMGTSEDQTAVAPGALQRSWKENGRSYFHYVTDGPIGSEWAFSSARYAVREENWKGVAIRFLHHPGHTGHLDRMMASIKASLDYYTKQIGPYRYNHITIAEIPGDGVGVHADASMLTHGEGVTLLKPNEKGRGSLDFPYAIMAHEMAHQWRMPIAFVEGAPILSESFAWYYAIKVVKHTKGDEQLRRLMQLMRQPYPIAPIRRGEPLLRGLDQYMSYRRGPFALVALSEYVGEEQINGALRRLYETHTAENAAPATTLDLYRNLQTVTPDSLESLLHDLFEVNAYWTFRAERVSGKQLADSSWEVTLDVAARKVIADSAGVETEQPLNEWIEVGVFAPSEIGELGAPLYLQKHAMRPGRQRIVVTVPRRPVLAGIDPRHLLDWVESVDDDDNIQRVEIPETTR